MTWRRPFHRPRDRRIARGQEITGCATTAPRLDKRRRRVTDVEEAAAKAHINDVTLEQARADLGIVVSRSNAGGVQAVQWSLPG